MECKAKNIIVGVFESDKVLTVQNLTNPSIGGDQTPCILWLLGHVVDTNNVDSRMAIHKKN